MSKTSPYTLEFPGFSGHETESALPSARTRQGSPRPGLISHERIYAARQIAPGMEYKGLFGRAVDTIGFALGATRTNDRAATVPKA